ncbi:MAG: tRNA lysidine(34) synthetase TilS [Clostridiales bacterium]|nr:tRNA lysidine(34) synthetase TilS [Clostridiales bacterium]
MSAAHPFPTDMLTLKCLEGRLLVGLSGGADSVALLLLLLDAGAEVAAVHVNHGLRGAESDGDEAFVRAFCNRLNVPLVTYRACPPENPGENWAREVRYGFFREAMQESCADALVLAHHRDDQAETLLLHLLRGAGLTGLTGMAADTWRDGMRILRPLLSYSRDELRAYLKEKNQPWREDASNGDARYLRNALRNELLPLMEQLAPGAAARMAQTAALLQEDEAVLNALTADFLAMHPGDALPLDALRTQPAGLQKRILRAWWTAIAAPTEERSLSSAQTDALHALVEAEASVRCNLPGDWHGQRGWTHLHLVSPEGAAAIPEMPAADCPLLRIEAFTGETGDGRGSQAIPCEWLNGCTIRSRRTGDFIRPFGQEGRQSLQDYFVNRRVDAAFRDRVPLLCRGSEVLLAGGVGAGNIPCTDEINDPVLLRWNAEFPWQRGGK